MFIGSKFETNEYVRVRDGVNIPYTRKKEIFSYKCDDCGINFERSRNGKENGENRLMHFCPGCYDFSKSTLQVKRQKIKNRLVGTYGKRRPRGKTKYIEVWTGTDSWHQKNPKNNGWIREHIFVIQEELGYVIPTGHVVHHIDGNKRNNDKKNLILLTVEEHNNAHAKSEQLIFQLVKNGTIIFNRHTKLYEFS